MPLLSWYHEDWDTRPDVDAELWRAQRDSDYDPAGCANGMAQLRAEKLTPCRSRKCALPGNPSSLSLLSCPATSR